MIKSSVWERLIMSITLVPITLLVIFFDFESYPLLNAAIMYLSAMAAVEMKNLLNKSFGLSISSPFAFFLGALPVVITYLLGIAGHGQYTAEVLLAAFVTLSFFVSLSLLNNRDSSVENLLPRLTLIGVLFLYPGLVFTFATRLSLLPHALSYVFLLSFIVFANDSLAYVFGRLFGKLIPGSLKVSPNKTVVGFVGGVLGSALSMVGAWYWKVLPLSLPTAIGMGIFLGFSVIWGDLLESAFKRRAGIKDSGTLIRGRGGVLDSSDSFFFATPILYYTIQLLN